MWLSQQWVEAILITFEEVVGGSAANIDRDAFCAAWAFTRFAETFPCRCGKDNSTLPLYICMVHTPPSHNLPWVSVFSLWVSPLHKSKKKIAHTSHCFAYITFSSFCSAAVTRGPWSLPWSGLSSSWERVCQRYRDGLRR